MRKGVYAVFIFLLTSLFFPVSTNAQSIVCCPDGSTTGDYCTYSLDPLTLGSCRPVEGPIEEAACGEINGESGYVCALPSEDPGTFNCICQYITYHWNCQVYINSCNEGHVPNTGVCYNDMTYNPCGLDDSCWMDCIPSSGPLGGVGDPCLGPTDCEPGLICGVYYQCVPDDQPYLQCCDTVSECDDQPPFITSCEDVAGSDCPSGRECAWTAPPEPENCCREDHAEEDCPYIPGYIAECGVHNIACNPNLECTYSPEPTTPPGANCCEEAGDCPPISGYIAECRMHDPICPVRVCSYAPVPSDQRCVGSRTGFGGVCGLLFCDPRIYFPDGWNPLTPELNPICNDNRNINRLYVCCIPWPDSSSVTRPPVNAGCTSPGGFDGINTAIGCITVNDTTEFITFILRFGVGVGGGVAFLLILFSALQIITSSGNPEKLKAGKELLATSISGLLLIIFSVFLLEIIGVRILRLPGF